MADFRLADREYERHPLSKAWGDMPEDDFDALVADVRAHGIRRPVALLGGMILDGWHRYRASVEAGKTCPSYVYLGDDAAGFVISENLHRRHLSKLDRATIAELVLGIDRERLKGRPEKACQDGTLSGTKEAVAEKAGVAPRTVSRARKRIEDVRDELPSEPTLDDVREAEKRVVVPLSVGGGPEWFTPAEWVDLVREVLGSIDLDPASCAEAQEIVGADTYYSPENGEDGIELPWTGNVFVNPPYRVDPCRGFVDRFLTHDGAGIMLTANATDADWGQALLHGSDAICFPEGRIKFVRPGGNNAGSAKFGQLFSYRGPDVARFEEVFSRRGKVFKP